ncbi:MAG TPA: hypothetical protein PKN33_06515 [Phycisphaerae bacterium]|nr:hypothetical protein [Phycisphaerae bacterium]
MNVNWNNILLGQVDHIEVERRLEFAALPTGWWTVATMIVAAVLVYAIIWFYRREGRIGASLRVRMVMAGLRICVMLCLLTILFEPIIATYLHRWVSSYTLVLVDASASMDLQDRYRRSEDLERVSSVIADATEKPVRRTEVVDQLLGSDDHRFLRELAENNRVKVHTFAENVQTQYTIRALRESADSPETPTDESDAASKTKSPIVDASGDEQLITQFQATGATTDIGRAVRQSIEKADRSPVAGIVLLTDGGINRGDSYGDIARFAQDHEIPLHIVGVGNAAPPRNVRVAEVIAPDNVFTQDPFAIVTQIGAQGMAGQVVTVELVEKQAGTEGEGQVVASQQVTLPEDNTSEPLTFKHRQQLVGRFVYQVQVPVAEDESVSDDNSQKITVNVVDNKIRVLVVAGAPSWEYRYVSRLLERDDTFEVSCWLQSADDDAARDGNIIIDHLPESAEELFKYDAIVLLDPDPLEITPEWVELADRLVTRHGGGLIYAASRLHAPAFARDEATKELLRILPVTFDPDADLVLNQIGHYQKQAHPLIVPTSSQGHPVLKLPGDTTAELSWANVGSVYWHFPVLREKPVATVLMRHGDPRMQNRYGGHVLLATQYAGSGRTAFLGIDSTWRWRAYGDNVFNKFWVQLVRYVVEGKLVGGNQRGSILTDRDSYQLGDVINVSARLFDRAYQPLQIPGVEAEYTIGDERGKFTLSRIADRPGWYEARFVPPTTGSCELMLPIPDGDIENDTVRREVQITRPNLEILQPQLARDQLIALAEQTPGGRYYDVKEAADLPHQIPDRHESTTIRSRPTPLWDETWVLLLLVGLLSTEWAMRKIFRLL